MDLQFSTLASRPIRISRVHRGLSSAYDKPVQSKYSYIISLKLTSRDFNFFFRSNGFFFVLKFYQEFAEFRDVAVQDANTGERRCIRNYET